MTSLSLSSSDTVQMAGSVNILRYDTPSQQNDDDRDELWYLFNFSAIHRYNRYFLMRIRADARLMHIVYLQPTRSADNNWNRVIRLEPQFEFRPRSEIVSKNTFEVLANYTVYDFEYGGLPIRSFAFRQFAFIDSSYIAITERLGFEWYNNIRLYERGELSWDSFSEKPVNYFEDKTYLGSICYSMERNLLFSVGIRYFSQKRFGYNGSERYIESFLRSMGPTTRIQVSVNGRTDILISGWYERQSQTGQPDRGYTTFVLTLNIHI